MKAYPRIQKIAAVLVGATLFASGSLKMVDPVGTGLIVEEYGKLFHAGILSGGFARTFGFVLSLFETICGGAMLTGVYRRTFRGAATALIGIFTVVTVFLVVRNPAMDCGCFGEAVHLSHRASLLKNLILLGLCVLSITPHVEPPASGRTRYVAGGFMAVGIIVAAVRSLMGIPPYDFTEFAPGVELAASQDNSLVAAGDAFELSFIYEKDGERAFFDLDSIEQAEADGWTYVGTESLRRVPESARDEVVTLSFLDRGDRLRDSLAARGNVLIVSFYDTARADEAAWQRTLETLHRAEKAGMRPLLLVEVSLTDLDRMLEGVPGEDFLKECSFQTDRRKLLALNRDNGGATGFSEGMLVKKWGVRKMPSDEALEEVVADPVEAMMVSGSRGRMTLQGYFLYALAVALLL